MGEVEERMSALAGNVGDLGKLVDHLYERLDRVIGTVTDSPGQAAPRPQAKTTLGREIDTIFDAVNVIGFRLDSLLRSIEA